MPTFKKKGQTGTNFGSSEALKVSQNSSENHLSYLKFKLDDISLNPSQKVSLLLYCKQLSANTSIKVFGTGNNWEENTITGANAPALNDELSNTKLTKEGAYYSWDITNYVQDAKKNGVSAISFALQNTQDNSVVFNSKEAMANKPFLSVNANDETLSIPSQNQGTALLLYPNPVVQGKLTLFNQHFNKKDFKNLTLYNITGKKMRVAGTYANHRFKLDLSAFASGVYLLSLVSEKGTFQKKVLIP